MASYLGCIEQAATHFKRKVHRGLHGALPDSLKNPNRYRGLPSQQGLPAADSIISCWTRVQGHEAHPSATPIPHTLPSMHHHTHTNPCTATCTATTLDLGWSSWTCGLDLWAGAVDLELELWTWSWGPARSSTALPPAWT